MKNVARITIALIILSSTTLFTQAPVQKSYFPKSLVNSILNDPSCTGIRVYPALNSSKEIVAMIIGIDKTGREIYHEKQPSALYQIFMAINSGEVTVDSLISREGQAACSAYTQKDTAFVSDFKKTALLPLLSEESEGLLFQYISNEGANFTASAYKDDKGLKPSGKSVMGDPCPMACGAGGNYLCSPVEN